MHGGLEFWFGGGAERFDFIANRILFLALSSLAPSMVDQLALGGGHEPRSRVGGDSRSGPGCQGGCEGFLQRVLGAVERSRETDQSGDDAAGLFAEDGLGGCLRVHGQWCAASTITCAGFSSSGRISMHPSAP